jgi:hypothetical protein
MATSKTSATAVTSMPEYPHSSAGVASALQGFLSPFAASLDKKTRRLRNSPQQASRSQCGPVLSLVPGLDPNLYVAARAVLVRQEMLLYQAALKAESIALNNFEHEVSMYVAA